MLSTVDWTTRRDLLRAAAVTGAAALAGCDFPSAGAGAQTEVGWRMPAEWEPHDCCWLAWPGENLLGVSELGALRAAHERLVLAVARFEPVLLVAPASAEADARRRFGDTRNVSIVPLPADDIWVRDTGPSFLLGGPGSRAAAIWRFNAWGGKNDAHSADAALGRRIAAHVDAPTIEPRLVTEGGAIEVDGKGVLLVTETALLNGNRNPGLTRGDADALLARTLGVERVVWLPGSAADEVTDGHIDGIAKFVRPGVVLSEVTADSAHPEYEALRENRRALELARDRQGRAFEVVGVERPSRVRSHAPTFCDSYVNAYLADGAVIMPRFGDERADAAAVETFKRCWPDREIVALDVDAICDGGGGIHCVTQQQPRMRSAVQGASE